MRNHGPWIKALLTVVGSWPNTWRLGVLLVFAAVPVALLSLVFVLLRTASR